MKTTSALLVTLMMGIGVSLTGCAKHEAKSEAKTEEIAAKQGEAVKAANPAPAAKEAATTTAAPAMASATSSTTTTTNTTTAASAPANTATATAPAKADTKAAAKPAGDGGEKLYAASCKTCHETGLAGAPKLGDKAAWKDRIAQGSDTMYKHAIAGFKGKMGIMPPKGGSTASDDEVKAAVDYMASKAT